MKEKRIIFFGAHPDDADILCSGTAIKLARAGHKVKFVSVTNGDTGHYSLSREETAKIRIEEARQAGLTSGIAEYQVIADQNCGVEPTLANRIKIMRILRSWNPDLVITHRLCDYHPDHRATAQLVMDCAYTCMVPTSAKTPPFRIRFLYLPTALTVSPIPVLSGQTLLLRSIQSWMRNLPPWRVTVPSSMSGSHGRTATGTLMSPNSTKKNASST